MQDWRAESHFPASAKTQDHRPLDLFGAPCALLVLNLIRCVGVGGDQRVWG